MAVKNKATGISKDKRKKLLSNSKRTLNDVWGIKLLPYDTEDPASYEESLREMTTLDLQREMARMERTPHHDRTTMIARLMGDFNKYWACQKPLTPIASNKNSKKAELVMRRLMDGGR